MNLKLRAAAITVGVVGGGIVAGFLLSYLPNWAVLAAAVAVVCYAVYATALAGLKFDESIDKMNSKYTDK
jgi:MFS family permease